MEEEDALSGTCELDEKYILESSKGVKTANRKARHRGEPSRLRGISHEQIRIVTTTDRTGHEVYNKVAHLNTVNSIHSMIEEKIRFYRGVSTKYLNRYCSLFVVMRRLCTLNKSELMDELLKKIKWAHISIHRNSLKKKYILDF